LQRRDLIDTPVGDYPRTREWAFRLHAETSAYGLLWISRQDDEAKALVLFGDRITESAFGIEIDREPLYEGKHLDALLTLAERLGITQLIGLRNLRFDCSQSLLRSVGAGKRKHKQLRAQRRKS